MKGSKTVWVFMTLSVIALVVTLMQTATYFEWWAFDSTFIEDIEKFTFFLINPVSLLVCFFLSIKLLIQTKKLMYLITLFVPIISVAFCIYSFWVRFWVELLS